MVQRFGSIIGLKPEYEERYIILHKHTFPGVLKRIRDSNIRNYSIFLREGRLFSYFEYRGQDYDEDMQNIGRDTITQEWWKLTDPMQEPIQDRKEGEWWASMDEVGHFSNAESSVTHTRRFAYGTQEKSEELENVDIPENILNAGHVHKLSVFYKERRLYLYCECADTSGSSSVEAKKDVIETTLSRITCDNQMFHWEGMREVFHTD